MSLNTKDLTVLNAHTKYKGNTKTAHLFHKQMLATLSKSNQKISRFIHSGVITDKNNQQLELPSSSVDEERSRRRSASLGFRNSAPDMP